MGIKISDYFPSRFLSGDEIKSSVVPVIISKVVEEMVPEKKGSTKEEPTLVVYFEDKKRGVNLNKTRAKEIRKITGEDDVSNWVGKHVMMCTAPEKAFGQVWNVIHFRTASGELPTIQVDEEERIAAEEAVDLENVPIDL